MFSHSLRHVKRFVEAANLIAGKMVGAVGLFAGKIAAMRYCASNGGVCGAGEQPAGADRGGRKDKFVDGGCWGGVEVSAGSSGR